jgi:hypothetical protein
MRDRDPVTATRQVCLGAAACSPHNSATNQHGLHHTLWLPTCPSGPPCAAAHRCRYSQAASTVQCHSTCRACLAAIHILLAHAPPHLHRMRVLQTRRPCEALAQPALRATAHGGQRGSGLWLAAGALGTPGYLGKWRTRRAHRCYKASIFRPALVPYQRTVHLGVVRRGDHNPINSPCIGTIMGSCCRIPPDGQLGIVVYGNWPWN